MHNTPLILYYSQISFCSIYAFKSSFLCSCHCIPTTDVVTVGIVTQIGELSPGQTIVTCQRNILQHCLRAFGHPVATCGDMMGEVGSNFTTFKLEPTTPNTSQHVTTLWPNARNLSLPTMLRYVAIVWPGLYRVLDFESATLFN